MAIKKSGAAFGMAAARRRRISRTRAANFMTAFPGFDAGDKTTAPPTYFYGTWLVWLGHSFCFCTQHATFHAFLPLLCVLFYKTGGERVLTDRPFLGVLLHCTHCLRFRGALWLCDLGHTPTGCFFMAPASVFPRFDSQQKAISLLVELHFAAVWHITHSPFYGCAFVGGW